MNKIVIYIISIFVLILVVFTTIINYKYYRLVNKNSELKYLIQHHKNINDQLYWNLYELKYIIEKTGICIDKKDIYDAISEYSKIRRDELKADGLDPIDIPPLSNINKTKIICGYNPHLKFEFDDKEILKSFSFYNYKSDIKFVY